MRILFVSSGHGLDDDRVTRKEAASLAKLGHAVTVCAQRRLPYAEPTLRLVDVETLREVSDAGHETAPGRSRWKRAARLLNLYRMVRRTSPDLIVAHEFETGLLAWWLRVLFGCRYVFDAHEYYEETAPAIFPRRLRPLVRRAVVRALAGIARRAEAVTVVAPPAEAFFRQLAPGTPCAILYNSPPLEYFPFCEAEGDAPVIVHEGTLTFERGALVLAEALAILKRSRDFRLLVLGTIPADVRPALETRLGALGLLAATEFRGRLPWTQFGAVEARGQIGVICSQPVPNHMLGLSNKLFNYMACGLAVLGMRGSATEALIRQYDCGIAVDTSNPAAVADGLAYLLDHPEERRRLARNGRKAMEEHLGWHRMELVLQQVYGSIGDRLAAAGQRA